MGGGGDSWEWTALVNNGCYVGDTHDKGCRAGWMGGSTRRRTRPGSAGFRGRLSSCTLIVELNVTDFRDLLLLLYIDLKSDESLVCSLIDYQSEGLLSSGK